MDRKIAGVIIDLIGKWQHLCFILGKHDNHITNKIICDLIVRYSEKKRHYHTLEHIQDCLKELQSVRHLLPHSSLVELALWFHDAVYNVNHIDNEIRSGALARVSLVNMGLDINSTLVINNSILWTGAYGVEWMLEPSLEAQYVMDIDLSSLGSKPDVFDENTEKIWLEYKIISGLTREKFNSGRASFFRNMLEIRPHIYCTDYFRKKYEAQAIENLKRAIRKIDPLSRSKDYSA